MTGIRELHYCSTSESAMARRRASSSSSALKGRGAGCASSSESEGTSRKHCFSWFCNSSGKAWVLPARASAAVAKRSRSATLLTLHWEFSGCVWDACDDDERREVRSTKRSSGPLADEPPSTCPRPGNWDVDDGDFPPDRRRPEIALPADADAEAPPVHVPALVFSGPCTFT